MLRDVSLSFCLVLLFASCCQEEKKAPSPVKKAPEKDQVVQAKLAPQASPEPAAVPVPAAKSVGTATKPLPPPAAPAAIPEPVAPAPAVESITGPVAPGDSVSVLYKGTLDDGTVFDASDRHNNKPLVFVAGKPGVIRGMSEGVMGMKVGEKKTLHITSDDAYGQYQEGAVIRQPLASFKQIPNLRVGMMIPMTNQMGQTFRFTVAKIEGDTVTLDANHPLAGKNLNFEVEVVKIERPVTHEGPAAPDGPSTQTKPPAPAEQATPAE